MGRAVRAKNKRRDKKIAVRGGQTDMRCYVHRQGCFCAHFDRFVGAKNSVGVLNFKPLQSNIGFKGVIGIGGQNEGW